MHLLDWVEHHHCLLFGTLKASMRGECVDTRLPNERWCSLRCLRNGPLLDMLDHGGSVELESGKEDGSSNHPNPRLMTLIGRPTHCMNEAQISISFLITAVSAVYCMVPSRHKLLSFRDLVGRHNDGPSNNRFGPSFIG
jgi:hypothetical protein